MNIFEVLSNIEWTWDKQESHQWIASFYVNKKKYEVRFTEDRGVTYILFALMSGKLTVLSITGTGDAHTIISTVLNIIQDYHRKNPHDMYSFSAEEPTRIKLYQRIAKTIAKYTGYSIETRSDPTLGVSYILSKKKKY